MIEIILEGTPPLPNSLGQGGHWSKRAKITKEWKETAAWKTRQSIAKKLFEPYHSKIDLLLFENKTYALPLKSVELIITRGASRMCDIDNGIASLKPILDGLKLAGLIEDDNPRVVRRIEFNQLKTPRNACYIKIQVVPIEEAPS